VTKAIKVILRLNLQFSNFTSFKRILEDFKKKYWSYELLSQVEVFLEVIFDTPPLRKIESVKFRKVEEENKYPIKSTLGSP
jgi:hypothetical protein